MGVDESGTLAALKDHRRTLTDPKIAEHGGRIVKTTGDGLLLEFPSVVDAVRCAVEVQRGMAGRNKAIASDRRLDFRIGINVGDIIIDGDDIFGDGVNVAARVEALADPGGICVSKVVRDQVQDKLNIEFEDLGPQQVKNIVRPVDVFRVVLVSKEATKRRFWQRMAQANAWRSRPARLLLTLAVLVGIGTGLWTATRDWLSPPVVAPYSSEDRRMTFAVLPYEAPTDDGDATRIAATLTDAVLASLESAPAPLIAQVASRRSVEQALARQGPGKNVTSDLNVHFLLRGKVTHADAAYKVELLVVDAATERVIGSKSVSIPADALTPTRSVEAVTRANGSLVYRALQTEVERVRGKAAEALDVRDLTFRAIVDWRTRKQLHDEKGAYITAAELLKRALLLSPSDPLALSSTATINLCDCVNAWSRNVEEQQAIGEAALETYLRSDPNSSHMLLLKSHLFALRGRYEDSLLIAESVLQRNPHNEQALRLKTYDSLKLGKLQDALAGVNELLAGDDEWGTTSLAAAIHYELGDYDLAARNARKAIVDMDRDDLSNPRSGAVALILIASEARTGQMARAKAALSEFNASVPVAQTIPAIRKWMHPAADLAGKESLFDGLRLAGVGD